MNAAAPTRQIAWEDRWIEPTVEQLLEPFNDPARRKILDTLLEKLGNFSGVESKLVWYGTAWRWTVMYSLYDEDHNQIDVMGYFVPNPTAPIVCIPMREAVIAKLPIKRLNRYIRDGIRSAKCAVELHWAMWNPSAGTEVDHLADLFKRKHKILLAANASK